MSSDAAARSYVEKKRDGQRRCDECNDEFNVVPGWNDKHVEVNIWGESATWQKHGRFCSEECARTWLRSVGTSDGRGGVCR